MKEISTNEAPAAIGPYVQAVESEGALYTSGQIPLTIDGEMAAQDITGQIRQVLANMDAILRASGRSRTDVVKTTIFLTDLADFQTVNEEYAAFFGNHRPARSTIQVAGLPRGAKVEIECIAAK